MDTRKVSKNLHFRNNSATFEMKYRRTYRSVETRNCLNLHAYVSISHTNSLLTIVSTKLPVSFPSHSFRYNMTPRKSKQHNERGGAKSIANTQAFLLCVSKSKFNEFQSVMQGRAVCGRICQDLAVNSYSFEVLYVIRSP